MGLPKDTGAVVAAFVVSGATHLVRPQTFEPLMPAWVPRHRDVIVASGVLELLCAAGLLTPATRRTAGWVSAALLVAVLPGNVKMALDAQRGHGSSSKARAYQVATLVRLPLQAPLIRAALKATRA